MTAGASPVPQVRTVRERMARVARACRREAPGRTCQHRGAQATHHTPTPRRHQPSTRAGRRQTRPPGASWDPGPARTPGGTTAGHLPPAREGRMIRANPPAVRVSGGPWRHIPKRHGKSASTPFSSMRSARHDGHRVATDESVGGRARSSRIARRTNEDLRLPGTLGSNTCTGTQPIFLLSHCRARTPSAIDAGHGPESNWRSL